MHVLKNNKIINSKNHGNFDNSFDFIDFELLSRSNFINLERRNKTLNQDLQIAEKPIENDAKLSN